MYLCAAQDLRLGTNMDEGNRASGNTDAIAHMSPEMIFEYIGILADTEKIADLSFTANVVLPTGNYVLRVKNGVVLYQTTLQEFQKQYGEAEAMENVSMEGYEDTEVRKYRYSWGYAYMAKLRTGWVLCRLNFTSRALSAPRGTGIGDSLSDVVGKFRDMGQAAGASGNRGLYKTDDNDVGKIWVQEDGGSLIRYTCTTADSHIWQLDYYTTESGIVNSIDMICYP